MSRDHLVLSAFGAAVLVGCTLLAFVWPPGELIANGVTCGVFLVLGIAAVGAGFTTGRARAYRAGFALLGSCYLAAVLGPWCDEHLAPMLITTTAFEALQERYGTSTHAQSASRVLGPPVKSFPWQVGHSLMALVPSLIGGAAARLFASAKSA